LQDLRDIDPVRFLNTEYFYLGEIHIYIEYEFRKFMNHLSFL
jgi:hypothetical protein